MKAFLLLLSMGLPGFRAQDATHVKSALSAYEAAQSEIRKDKPAGAIALLQKAIEIEPTFLEAYETLADEFLKTGRSSEAGAAMTQLLEIEPDAIPYRVLLGELLLKQKQTERALAQFSLALKREPENADALAGFAAAAKELGMRDRAAQALEHGRKRYPLDNRFKVANTTGNDSRP